jgi:hypothetical protein
MVIWLQVTMIEAVRTVFRAFALRFPASQRDTAERRSTFYVGPVMSRAGTWSESFRPSQVHKWMGVHWPVSRAVNLLTHEQSNLTAAWHL